MSHTCSTCGSVNDHAIRASYPDAADDGPEAAMCAHCGEIYVVEQTVLGTVFREPTLEELMEIQQQHGRIIELVTALRAERPLPPNR